MFQVETNLEVPHTALCLSYSKTLGHVCPFLENGFLKGSLMMNCFGNLKALYRKPFVRGFLLVCEQNIPEFQKRSEENGLEQIFFCVCVKYSILIQNLSQRLLENGFLGGSFTVQDFRWSSMQESVPQRNKPLKGQCEVGHLSYTESEFWG